MSSQEVFKYKTVELERREEVRKKGEEEHTDMYIVCSHTNCINYDYEEEKCKVDLLKEDALSFDNGKFLCKMFLPRKKGGKKPTKKTTKEEKTEETSKERGKKSATKETQGTSSSSKKPKPKTEKETETKTETETEEAKKPKSKSKRTEKKEVKKLMRKYLRVS